MKSVLRVFAIVVAVGAGVQTVVKATANDNQPTEIVAADHENVVLELLVKKDQARYENSGVEFTEVDQAELKKAMREYLQIIKNSSKVKANAAETGEPGI